MLLLISDTNVLIDIEIGKLTNFLFKLPYEIAVPDVLFSQELAVRHNHLLQCGLKVKSISGTFLEKTISMANTYRQVSRIDLFALGLAKQMKCPLLTGDKKLRKIATIEGIVVHGTVWLVEQMLNNEILSYEYAEKSYSFMKEQGSRLPWEEVEKQLASRKENALIL